MFANRDIIRLFDRLRVSDSFLLQNNLRKTQTATQKQADLVKINENTRKNLEVEIQGYKGEAQKQRKMIYQRISTIPLPTL